MRCEDRRQEEGQVSAVDRCVSTRTTPSRQPTDPGRKPEEANNKTPLPEEYRDPDAATRRPERRAADGWEPYFGYGV